MNDSEGPLEYENVKSRRELPPRGGFLKRNPLALVALVLVPLILLIEGPSLTRLLAGNGEVKDRTGSILWRSDYGGALRESGLSGKPVLVDFGATWCPGCVAMDHDVWTDKEVGDRVMKDYIPVHLDFDRAGSAPVIEQYHVQAIPEVLVLNAKGVVLAEAQLMDKVEVLAFLRAGVEKKPEGSDGAAGSTENGAQ